MVEVHCGEFGSGQSGLVVKLQHHDFCNTLMPQTITVHKTRSLQPPRQDVLLSNKTKTLRLDGNHFGVYSTSFFKEPNYYQSGYNQLAGTHKAKTIYKLDTRGIYGRELKDPTQLHTSHACQSMDHVIACVVCAQRVGDRPKPNPPPPPPPKPAQPKPIPSVRAFMSLGRQFEQHI